MTVSAIFRSVPSAPRVDLFRFLAPPITLLALDRDFCICHFNLATRSPSDFDRKVVSNDHLARVWSEQLDEIIKANINRLHWHWYADLTDHLIDLIGKPELEDWKARDPLCKEYAWYNVLLTYADARAVVNGWTKTIRRPKIRTCPLCRETFREDTLSWTTARRLTMDQLDFCESCVHSTLICREFERCEKSGFDDERKEESLKWVVELAQVIERVPHKDFGFGLTDLHGLSTEKRLSVFELLRHRDEEQLQRLQGHGRTWFDVLMEAGVLPEGSRMTGRGIQCRAEDGHMCFSLGEKTIDDLLFRWGVPHLREPTYPGETSMRGDFLVEGVFIEYFGLHGDPEYDAKSRRKARVLKSKGVPMIAITSKDLATGRYVAKLKKGLEKAGVPVGHDDLAEDQMQREDE